ncbi:MAG: hypothetical protein LBG43_04790 [Treponema sp.]|nr:hypothetical protein [Treponema sp.]
MLVSKEAFERVEVEIYQAMQFYKSLVISQAKCKRSAYRDRNGEIHKARIKNIRNAKPYMKNSAFIDCYAFLKKRANHAKKETSLVQTSASMTSTSFPS